MHTYREIHLYVTVYMFLPLCHFFLLKSFSEQELASTASSLPATPHCPIQPLWLPEVLRPLGHHGATPGPAGSRAFLGSQAHCSPQDFSKGRCGQEGSKCLFVDSPGGCSVVRISVSGGNPMAGALNVSFSVSVSLGLFESISGQAERRPMPLAPSSSHMSFDQGSTVSSRSSF